MLVPDCHMQTVFLKDLVSAVAPTNPYSFVNYLVKHKSSIASLQAGYVQYPVKSFLTISAGLLKIWITCISVIPLKILISTKKSIVSGSDQSGRIFCPQYLPWYRKTTLFTTLCEACDTILFPCQWNESSSAGPEWKTDNRGWWRTEWCRPVP